LRTYNICQFFLSVVRPKKTDMIMVILAGHGVCVCTTNSTCGRFGSDRIGLNGMG